MLDLEKASDLGGQYLSLFGGKKAGFFGRLKRRLTRAFTRKKAGGAKKTGKKSGRKKAGGAKKKSNARRRAGGARRKRAA